jgi:hypothetical protein
MPEPHYDRVQQKKPDGSTFPAIMQDGIAKRGKPCIATKFIGV